MDIRSFFGNTPKSGGSKEPTTAAQKATKKQSTPRKRSEKKATLEELVGEELSDGEDPLPRSLRNRPLPKKRNRIVLSSDSDDDQPLPPKTKKNNVIVPTPEPSPVKPANPAKKSRVLISSDSDVTPIKKKPSRRTPTPEPIEIDDESDVGDIVIKSGSQVKKGKQLPPGQKQLSFDKSAPAPQVTKKKEEYIHVDPADFFKTVSKKKTVEKKPVEQPKTSKVEKQKTPTPVKSSSSPKKITISPSQKENTNEFADSDDDFTPIAKKMKTTPELDKKTSKPTTKTPEKKETQKQKAKSITPEKKMEKVVEKHVKKASPEKKLPVKPTISSQSSQSSTSSATPDVVKTMPVKPMVPSQSSQSSSTTTTAVPQSKRDDSMDLPWVDKYKPKTQIQLVGQVGDKSPMNKLLEWLKAWAKLNLGEGGKVKRAKPAAWGAQQDGTAFKAVLLSGSPGVGKTTCAYLACDSLGLKRVEMNASDVRNKKHLEANVGQLASSHQIEQFFGAKKSASVPQDNLEVHHVLIMDEVDGMSGNEDRAGVSELIQIIKDTKIPIICICNDRMHPKIRSLANYCYDLRFHKPRVEQIRARMMTIAMQEKVKITKEELDELIETSGHDVRQSIYNLQMRGRSEKFTANKKDVSLSPFEAARKLLDQNSTLRERNEMFFVDYGIMPLFVQENYLNMRNDKHSALKAMRNVRTASDCISMGDNVEKVLRSRNAWKLLNEQSMLSSALPAQAMDAPLRGMLQFPSWLGRNSTANKRKRLLTQLVMHTHLKVSGGSTSFAMDYAPTLRERLTQPLLKRESDGIGAVIETMDEYDLVKDDSEALGEIAVWPGKIDPASKILSKVKAALTRTLNKEKRMLPYSLADIAKGKRKAGGANDIDDVGDFMTEYDDIDDDEEEEDDAKGGSEVVIKVVQKGFAGKAARGGGGGGRGSRGGGRGRGKK